jgi:hypothetical protein
MIQDSAYSAVWAEAAKKALTPAQCRSVRSKSLAT